MGKTIKKNQVRKNVRSTFGGAYVVKGKTFAINDASSDAIAADMASNGYRAGAMVRWNGRAYRLARDIYGEFSLEHVA